MAPNKGRPRPTLRHQELSYYSPYSGAGEDGTSKDRTVKEGGLKNQGRIAATARADAGRHNTGSTSTTRNGVSRTSHLQGLGWA